MRVCAEQGLAGVPTCQYLLSVYCSSAGVSSENLQLAGDYMDELLLCILHL